MRAVAVVGPTASGKSRLALALAARVGGEVVGVDSMQVYRRMDIGTAKPSAADRAAVRHHLIDVVDPSEPYSVAEFQEAGRRALEGIERRGATAIIAGGSGLHFRALVDPLEFPPTDEQLRSELEAQDPDRLVAELVALDPDAHEWVDLANPRRVIRAMEIFHLTGATPSRRRKTPQAAAVRDYRPIVDLVAIGVDPGEALAERVERRLDAMLAAGWLDEAAGVAPDLGPTAARAIGYRELASVATGELELSAARAAILQATLSFAKRQRTFFRRDPRIRWLPWHDGASERLAAAVSTLEEVSAWTS